MSATRASMDPAATAGRRPPISTAIDTLHDLDGNPGEDERLAGHPVAAERDGVGGIQQLAASE